MTENHPINLAVNVPASRDPAFSHERLDAYALALEFHSQATTLVPRRGYRVLRDQLERASLSIVLCIAEGAGRTSPQDKRHFYAMARGSATECAAILDVLRIRRLVEFERCGSVRSLLLRIVQMLSRLCLPR